jgi:transglutaminase-like putative cysteine protease
LPIPVDQPYQAVSWQVQGAKADVLVRNGDYSLVAVSTADKPFSLHVVVTLKPYDFSKALKKRTQQVLPEAVRIYLAEEATVKSRSDKLSRLAAKLKGADPASTVANICRWLPANIKSKYDPGKSQFKTLDEILDRGHAECLGFSTLFTGIARNAGIPTRTIWGVLKAPVAFLEFPAGTFLSHNWNEVYLAGVGWLPVDVLDRTAPFGVAPKHRLRICPFGLGDADGPEHARLAIHNFGTMSGDFGRPRAEVLKQ